MIFLFFETKDQYTNQIPNYTVQKINKVKIDMVHCQEEEDHWSMNYILDQASNKFAITYMHHN